MPSYDDPPAPSEEDFKELFLAWRKGKTLVIGDFIDSYVIPDSAFFVLADKAREVVTAIRAQLAEANEHYDKMSEAATEYRTCAEAAETKLAEEIKVSEAIGRAFKSAQEDKENLRKKLAASEERVRGMQEAVQQDAQLLDVLMDILAKYCPPKGKDWLDYMEVKKVLADRRAALAGKEPPHA